MATPVISVSNIVLGEKDGFATFMITLNVPSANTVTVGYETENGTAVADTDYTADSGTLTFMAGETIQTVQVPIVDASMVAAKEDFFLDLLTPVNAVIGTTSALATVIANTAPSGTPVMSIGNRVVDAEAGTVTFAVILNEPSTGTVTVNYATSAGTDTANDFVPISGTLAFAPGETEMSVTVQLTVPTSAEPEESFNLVLSNVSGATLPNAVGTAVIGPVNQPTVTTPVVSVADVTAGEADGYVEFVVRLNAPSTKMVTVTYETENGTAVANTDLIGVSGSLTFAPGETVQTVQVPISDGSGVAAKEDFFFDLLNPVNAVIGNTSALATVIANTAPSGTPVMSIGNRVVDAEAGTVTFAIILNEPSTGTVTVNYATSAGTDTANDFVPVSGTAAFAPGETEKTVTVLLTTPTTAEPEESFNLVLSNVSGATLPNAVGTAVIGPVNQLTVITPVISVANVTAGEADGYVEFVVRLNLPSTNPVTVTYETENGTAVANTDYIGVSGSLTFAPGETVQTVQVPISDGSGVAAKEDFFFDLLNPVNAVIGNTSALATVIANTAPSGTPVMSIGNRVVDAEAGTVTFAIILNEPSTGTVTVNYATSAGTDTANDFVPVSGTAAFAPGETEKTVTVLLTTPTTAEPEESFNLVLSNVSGATLPNAVGTAAIGPVNQPTVITPVISVANVTAGEADGYVEFVVRLNLPSTNPVTVTYETENGTAVANTDLIGVSGSLTFAPGETVQTVQVPISDGSGVAAKEDFFFDLLNPVNAVIGNTSALATVIANTAPSGTPVMSIGNRVVDAEAGTVTFAIILNEPSTGTVTVNYATSAGTDTANDFVPVSGTAAFAPGETEKTVTVLLTTPTTAEPEESFNLVLSNVSGATLPNAVGTAVIGPVNQPTVITPVISVANVTAGEADGYVEFVVRLNLPSTNPVTVTYETENGTAVANTDLIGVSGSLTFAPGETVQTVQVPISDGSGVAAKEDFFFDLLNPVNAVIGNTSALATVIANTAPSGTPVMSIGNRVVDAEAGTVTFAIILNEPSTGTVTVNYATSAGTDTANDFVPVSGTAAFAPGETEKTVTVLLTTPTTAEPEESFNLVLSNVSGATLPNAVGTAVIGPVNQPTVITPVISVANVTAGEADGYVEFVVRLNLPSTNPVTVTYETENGTAVANTDYIGVNGSLTFAPGETVQTVQVPVVDVTTTQPQENFFFDLLNPVNATIAPSSTQSTATIVDNPNSEPAPAGDDFAGTGTSDILWQNNVTGDTGYWLMSGGQVSAWQDFGDVSTSYSIVGVGDFDGDVTSGILWRNNSTGDTGAWLLPPGGGQPTWDDLGTVSTAYSVVGVGDFTGGGGDDILWRDAATGDTGYWTMSDGKETGWTDFGDVPTSYNVVGVGDFTGNGTSDILWQNPTTGDTGIFLLNGNGQHTWLDLATVSFAYSVVGIGDFNGNGIDDVLFRNASTGDTGYWQMNSSAQFSWVDLGLASTAYSVIGVGDYTGNGISDILWRNSSTGDTGYWAMNTSGEVAGWVDLGAVPTTYHVPKTV